MKNQRNERGITLVALVVTIVVLLILAGITITYVLSDNGIFGKAKDATIQTAKGHISDQVNLAIVAIQADVYTDSTYDMTKANTAVGSYLSSAGITGTFTFTKASIADGLVGSGDLTYDGVTCTATLNTNAAAGTPVLTVVVKTAPTV